MGAKSSKRSHGPQSSSINAPPDPSLSVTVSCPCASSSATELVGEPEMVSSSSCPTRSKASTSRTRANTSTEPGSKTPEATDYDSPTSTVDISSSSDEKPHKKRSQTSSRGNSKNCRSMWRLRHRLRLCDSDEDQLEDVIEPTSIAPTSLIPGSGSAASRPVDIANTTHLHVGTSSTAMNSLPSPSPTRGNKPRSSSTASINSAAHRRPSLLPTVGPPRYSSSSGLLSSLSLIQSHKSSSLASSLDEYSYPVTVPAGFTSPASASSLSLHNLSFHNATTSTGASSGSSAGLDMYASKPEKEWAFELSCDMSFPYRITFLVKRQRHPSTSLAFSPSSLSVSVQSGHSGNSGALRPASAGERTLVRQDKHFFYETIEFTVHPPEPQFVSISALELLGVEVTCGWQQCVFDCTALEVDPMIQLSVQVKVAASSKLLAAAHVHHAPGGSNPPTGNVATPTTPSSFSRGKTAGSLSVDDEQRPFVARLAYGWKSIAGSQLRTICCARSYRHNGGTS